MNKPHMNDDSSILIAVGLSVPLIVFLVIVKDSLGWLALIGAALLVLLVAILFIKICIKAFKGRGRTKIGQ